MRVVETFSEKGFKVTIFKTDSRYLIQLEEGSYMLSWKMPVETDFGVVKASIAEKLVPLGKELWPTFQNQLKLKRPPRIENENDFPQII